MLGFCLLITPLFDHSGHLVLLLHIDYMLSRLSLVNIFLLFHVKVKHTQYLKIAVYWSNIPNRCYCTGQSERKPKHLQVTENNSNNCCRWS